MSGSTGHSKRGEALFKCESTKASIVACRVDMLAAAGGQDRDKNKKCLGRPRGRTPFSKKNTD